MRRTTTGLLLEKILSNLKHRYLLCWNGEDGAATPYDCACCMTWCDDEMYSKCGCICHDRIEKMASDPHIHLWLFALGKTDELPPFFTSYDDKLVQCRQIAAQHAEDRKEWKRSDPCTCEYCEFVQQHDAKPPVWHAEHKHKFIPPGNDDEQQCDTDCRMNWHKCECGKTRAQVEAEEKKNA